MRMALSCVRASQLLCREEEAAPPVRTWRGGGRACGRVPVQGYNIRIQCTHQQLHRSGTARNLRVS